jgi:hypothetical protein
LGQWDKFGRVINNEHQLGGTLCYWYEFSLFKLFNWIDTFYCIQVIILVYSSYNFRICWANHLRKVVHEIWRLFHNGQQPGGRSRVRTHWSKYLQQVRKVKKIINTFVLIFLLISFKKFPVFQPYRVVWKEGFKKQTPVDFLITSKPSYPKISKNF